jgi:hypothetical protein
MCAALQLANTRNEEVKIKPEIYCCGYQKEKDARNISL